MTDLRRFRQAMKSQIAAVEKAIEDRQRDVVSAFYKTATRLSPVYSGYYKANHRISFTGLVELFPAKRTTQKGAHFDQIETAKANELAKLSSKKLPVVVTIGTAVKYALAMEDPSGGGVTPVTGVRPVYSNARALVVEDFKGGIA